MSTTLQAVTDVGLIALVAVINAWILRLLLVFLARGTSIAKFGGTLCVVLAMTASAALVHGRYPDLPIWAVAAGAFASGLPSLYYICGIAWRHAALTSLALVLAGGTVRHLANTTADRMMPGRWTIEQQLGLAQESMEKLAELIDTNQATTVTGQLVRFFDEVNKILDPAEAESLVQQVDLGLAQLREMRALATNEMEIAKSYEHYGDLRDELLGATGTLDLSGADGKINFEELRSALAELSGGPSDASAATDEDLNRAASALWQTITSSNGIRSLKMLAGSMGAVAAELAASRTNTAISAVAMRNAATLAQSISGTFSMGGGSTRAAATLSATSSNTVLRLFVEAAIKRQQIIEDYRQSDAFLASQLTDKVHPAFVGPLPRDGWRELFVGPFLKSGARSLTATDAVTVVSGTPPPPPPPPRIVHEIPPSELNVQAVMQKAEGLGYALCNDRIIPIGDTIAVKERNGKLSVWKLESITNNRCLWSRVRFDTAPATINVN